MLTLFFPYPISEGRQNIRALHRHSAETVTLCEYVPEHEQMYKWMVEFFSKFQGRGIKMNRVNSIPVAKSLIFLNI